MFLFLFPLGILGNPRAIRLAMLSITRRMTLGFPRITLGVEMNLGFLISLDISQLMYDVRTLFHYNITQEYN